LRSRIGEVALAGTADRLDEIIEEVAVLVGNGIPISILPNLSVPIRIDLNLRE
jgi:hypothetical protein